MHLAAAEARYDEAHEELPYHDGTFQWWSKSRSKDFPFHYRDGVRLWVSRDDLTPGENILAKPMHYQLQRQLLASAEADALADGADEH